MSFSDPCAYSLILPGSENKYIVKIKCIADNEPLIGASLYVIDNNPPTQTITDINGISEIAIPTKKATVQISYLGPYTTFNERQPVDSILFNLNKKRVTYYYKSKKTGAK